MGKRPRTKMPVSQRAKQFAPFQAVGGLDEALKRAEEEHRLALEKECILVKNEEGEEGIYNEI